MPTLVRGVELPHSAETVFRWHERPGALERLLPPWADVRVLERSGGLAEGARVRLRLRLGAARWTWELRQTAHEEGRRFRDEQVTGPFAAWSHDHRFVPLGEGRSRMEDEVEWRAPLGAADGWIARELERLLDFRHRRLANDLALHARFADRPRLRVAVSGSSGFIGRSLTHFLTSGGHVVQPLVRSRDAARRATEAARAKGDEGGSGAEGRGGAGAGGGGKGSADFGERAGARGRPIRWSVDEGEVDREGLAEVDAVVHLAGEPLMALRWTESKKRAIRDSRVRGTRLLAGTLASIGRGPRTLVTASGIHYYGDRGDERLPETSSPGRGFLPDVCRAWEEAAEPAREAGIRVASVRSGLVLSPAGGALRTMLLPFRLGLGGRLGNGRQYVSWIDHDDEIGLFHHALMTEAVRGPVNGCAPAPVRSRTFTDVLGSVLGRPTLLPLPAAAVSALMGEMGETLLLQGQRAVPGVAEETGYRFLFDTLEASLRHGLGRT